MPYTPITTNYAGDDIGEILELLIIGNEAIEKGVFHIHEGVQKQREITRGYVNDNPIQAYQAYPTTPIQALSFIPRVVAPVKMTLFDLINPMDFQSFWQEYQPEGPLVDKVLDTDILRVITDLYSKKADNQLGKMVWQGDTTGTIFAANQNISYFQGVISKLYNDATILKPTPSGNITAANIVTFLGLMDQIIPDTLYNVEEYAIHMSTANCRMYLDYLVNTLTYKGPGPSDISTNNNVLNNLTYKGRKIINYTGFPSNFMLMGKASTNPVITHFHMAMNAENDPENLKIERWRPEGDLYFIKANMSMDVNVSFPEEMVLYRPS
jgi:hypothetical protein